MIAPNGVDAKPETEKENARKRRTGLKTRHYNGSGARLQGVRRQSWRGEFCQEKNQAASL
jgi:hypothetical protein